MYPNKAYIICVFAKIVYKFQLMTWPSGYNLGSLH